MSIGVVQLVKIMKQLNNLALLVITLLIVSCRPSDGSAYRIPEFKSVNTLEKIEFLTDDLGFNSVNDIFKHGNYLYVIAYDFKSQYFLHVYDIKTGEHVRSSIKYGNGPNEIIYPGISYFDYETGHLFFYDKVKQELYQYSVTDDILLVNSRALSLSPWLTNYFQVSEDKYIRIQSNRESSKEDSNNPRIALYDNNNNLLYAYNNYPLSGDDSIRHIVYTTISGAMSINKKYIVTGTVYGGILEIFNVSDGINLSSVHYFVEPTLILRNGNFDNDDTILGFNDLFATPKYIYASYDGENYGDVPVTKFFNNIAVFDYKGRPIGKLRLNNTVERICVDEDNKKIYCVLTLKNGEVKLAEIDMNNIMP